MFSQFRKYCQKIHLLKKNWSIWCSNKFANDNIEDNNKNWMFKSHYSHILLKKLGWFSFMNWIHFSDGYLVGLNGGQDEWIFSVVKVHKSMYYIIILRCFCLWYTCVNKHNSNVMLFFLKWLLKNAQVNGTLQILFFFMPVSNENCWSNYYRNNWNIKICMWIFCFGNLIFK